MKMELWLKIKLKKLKNFLSVSMVVLIYLIERKEGLLVNFGIFKTLWLFAIN